MGILLWIGQISGMAFVALMSMKSNQYIGEIMAIFAGLAVVAFIMSLVLRESPMVRSEEPKVS